MAVSLKHNFVSTVPNDANSKTVGSLEWNEEHNFTMSSGKILGRSSSGTGAVEELDPSSVSSLLNINAINVKDYGATGDGSTDDTSAVSSAWSAAVALSKPAIYFPAGTYIVQGATYLQLVSNMLVYGDGMEQSTIYWKDNGETQPQLIGRTFADGAISNVEIRDIHIRGQHGDSADYTSDNHFPISITRCDNLNIERVKISYSRLMGMAIRGSTRVRVHGCVVEYCARDGISTAGCDNVIITDNTVQFCDDDGIAHHNRDADIAQVGCIISNNNLRFCQGIKALGVKTATISNNTLEWCIAQGIDVNPRNSPDEGQNAGNGVVISGNTIKNVIDRNVVDGLSSTASYIRISGDSAQAGSEDAIPGTNYAAGGTIVDPYPYFKNSSFVTATNPVPITCGVVITGNTLVRDAGALTNISDLGLGTFWMRGGPEDPQILGTTADIIKNGIQVMAGEMRDLVVSNNVLHGMQNGFIINSGTKITGSIHGNTFTDMRNACITSSSAEGQRLYIFNNVFDADPYHLNSNRGANGTWSAFGAPYGILVQSDTGFVAYGNVFKNMAAVSDVTFLTTPNQDLDLTGGNIVECDPASSSGFSASNKGVGQIIATAGDRLVYRIMDCDPASANYGDLKNVCFRESGAMPSSGTYVDGHIVWNSDPNLTGTLGDAYTILGWRRLTTGSGHALGTDWAVMRAHSSDTETWYVLGNSAVAASHTGDLLETTLATITVPAGAMGANGILRITTLWSLTNSANNKTLRVKFGGTTMHSVTTALTTGYHQQMFIMNRNSASSQIANQNGTNPATAGWGITTGSLNTATINTASAANLTITVQLANAGDTATLEAYMVELLYRA